MNWFGWLLGRSDDPIVENWSDARARHYEQQTYRYLGIRPEPTYTWAKKFRPKRKVKKPSRKVQAQVLSLAERRKA